MFKFRFVYKDKREISVDGVDKVSYNIVGMETTVEGEDILTYQFPLSNTLHLYGKNCSHTISHDGLVSIHVTREEN